MIMQDSTFLMNIIRIQLGSRSFCKMKPSEIEEVTGSSTVEMMVPARIPQISSE
jgi:hypothetical protein